MPSIPFAEQAQLNTGECVEVTRERMHKILVGGEQMTAARGRSALNAKANAETPSMRLGGLWKTGIQKLLAQFIVISYVTRFYGNTTTQ